MRYNHLHSPTSPTPWLAIIVAAIIAGIVAGLTTTTVQYLIVRHYAKKAQAAAAELWQENLHDLTK